ncbi:ero1-like protein isoform X5 [Cherax quadricarinatus]|uniref:ero1-like protein isoform X5 n=1 Tax=Cherax quadricarinatus TaxID=27406 RepID=UPI00387E888E
MWWWRTCILVVMVETTRTQWFQVGHTDTKGDTAAGERCFCQLKGAIDDCSCSVETIDSFNNLKIFPRLNSLLHQNFFRYWKVNLKKKCPFWEDDGKCAIRYCSVQPCTDIPEGIKGAVTPNGIDKSQSLDMKSHMTVSDCDTENALGYLNTTLRPTQSFRPYADFRNIGADDFLKELCLEKRAFYRAISGLHSSINVHLAAHYLLSDKNGFAESKDGVWGHNVEEFQRRFDPELTGGEGPLRLKNLYFVYLLELRALAKAAPYLESLEFYTGNEEIDSDVRKAVEDLLAVIQSFPEHFREETMFTGGLQATKLKEEFREHFRNISRIMDCVGCDKCRLWGKLQVTGLGTALKILFSGNFDQPLDQQLNLSAVKQTKFQLSRGEIVSLFNAFGRLSRSIMELDNFRQEILR